MAEAKFWRINHAADTTETGMPQRRTYVKTTWRGFAAQQSCEDLILREWCRERFGPEVEYVQGVAPCPGWTIHPIAEDEFRAAAPIMWGGRATKTETLILALGAQGSGSKVRIIAEGRAVALSSREGRAMSDNYPDNYREPPHVEPEDIIDGIIAERDSYSDAMGDTWAKLDPPREDAWVGRSPTPNPPDSGDLRVDLPAQASIIMARLKSAEDALRDTMRVTKSYTFDRDTGHPYERQFIDIYDHVAAHFAKYPAEQEGATDAAER